MAAKVLNILKGKHKKLFLGIFFILLSFPLLHPVGGDGDYYHHLNIGKDIVSSHQLPHFDTYTFTANGKEWVGHSWLSGVMLYLLDTSIGPIGTSVIVALVGAFTFFLLYLWLRTYNLPDNIVLPAVLLICGVFSQRWPSRPEIFTYPFVLVLFIIDRTRKRYPSLVYSLPFIILLWANFYGAGVIIGVFLLFIFIIKQAISDKFQLIKNQIPFYLSSLIAIVISVFNGYGFKSLFYTYSIQEMMKTEMEWYGVVKLFMNAPYSYMLSVQYHILIYFLVLFLLLLLAIKARAHIQQFKFEILLALGIFVPLLAFRQFPLASIVVMPLMGLLLVSIGGNSRKIYLRLMFGVAAFSVLIGPYTDFPRLIRPEGYPPDLVPFMQKNNLTGNILNQPQDGGYLSYHLYPQNKIYADTRDELYKGTFIYEDYFKAAGEMKLDQLLEQYEIDIIVGDLSLGPVFQPVFNSQEWQPVYLAGRYFIALPTEVVKEKGLKPLAYADPYLPSATKNGFEEEALVEYGNNASNESASVDDKLRYAYALYFQKKYPEAISEIEKINSSHSPKNVLFNMSKDYLMAMVYIGMGDCSQADRSLLAVNQGIKGIMLFTPSKDPPPLAERGRRVFQNACRSQIDRLQPVNSLRSVY